MGLMSKEAENLVLFERAEILDNLDQRFVPLLGAFAQFIDRMVAVIAISVRRLFHRHSHLKDKASV